MFRQLDFAAYDPGGRLAVAVEVKRTFGMGDAWATGWRSNFLEDAPASLTACNHMLVTPDRIFIWPEASPRDASPAHQLDATPHLKPYFERLGISARDIEARAFESLVGWWLRDLSAHASDRLPAEVRKVLSGTRIVQEDAA